MKQSVSFNVLEISARSDVGGGPAHMYALAAGLNKKVTLSAALPSDGHFYRQFQALLGDARVFEIPRQKFTVSAFFKLCIFCKKQHIDLIHSHGKGAGVYSRLLGLVLGVPVVHTLHGYHDGRYSNLFKRIYAVWETAAAFITKKIVCVSNSEAELFKNKVNVPDEKLTVIPNGTQVVTTEAVKPVAKMVVTVARFDYQKNLLEFLDVARKMPGYDFFIIGDGADRPLLEAKIAEQHIHNVTLSGLSHQVMKDISDAEVYLTTARWEGMPLSVLEAMSLGIPVVATDVVGNRDAVKVGVTGYLYPLGDLSACVRAIEEATLLDRSQVKRFHQEYFSSDRMIARTFEVYEDVLQEKAAQ